MPQKLVDRRTFIKGTGGLALAAAASPLLSSVAALASNEIPLQHIVVDMQENRSFDTYYGFAPFAGRFGIPSGYSQPGPNGPVAPYHFTSLSTPDIGHSWSAMHAEYDGGGMDGFYRTDGINCMGYYTASDLPFYYSLAENYTLCGNYFHSLMGPTWPNRFYLASATSGGITTNGIWGYGVLDYPMILDLLDAAGVTWKVYNIGMDSVPYGNTDNVFLFWKNFAHDNRTRGSKGDYLNDLSAGKLPNVAFLIPSYARGWDEHPPADVSVGMGIQQELITALQQSSAWSSAAYILTYDEAGGYFDHVKPPQLDAFGLGFRVPTWVISPYARKGHVEGTLYEHSSILKFIETVFGLPTLASVNHEFDASTPNDGSNYEAANGAAVGPPAPPRDGMPGIGNLMECFDF
jgi:phospholipase C